MVQRITLHIPDIDLVDVFVDQTNLAVAFKNSECLHDREMIRRYIEDAIVEYCISATACDSISLMEMREIILHNRLFIEPKVLFIDEFLNGEE